MRQIPDEYRTYWSQHGAQRRQEFTSGESGWIRDLAPEIALNASMTELLGALRERLGEARFRQCLDPEYRVESPVAHQQDGHWLRRCHMAGVNVRTVGSFWNVLKYALTLPGHIQGVHLLPIWEPGVVGSLYGMASWQLNPEFFDHEAAAAFPDLRSPEAQLVVVINFLHALGKVVGMDVIPHTDRYSEMVLANPDHFEWIRRKDTFIISHREYLHEEVQGAITDWLRERGPALSAYGMVGGLWELSEENRLKLFFGHPDDHAGRRDRRVDLVDWLYHRGLEPAPATMAPPYRGLEVDPSPEAMTVDDAGRVWRDYRITEPEEMSRVFGPLTRYKLYGRKRDNAEWEIDFDQPRRWVWDYLTGHYAEQQRRYNFDFMRGDMSHVQMRPAGVPDPVPDFYDPLRAVKERIAERVPHFAYFAESFLTEPDFMAYGDEVEHLKASLAEVTLGNLQSMVPGDEEFMEAFADYLKIQRSSTVTPAWTVITGDKDDPRFDHFHHHGEVARMFTGLFLGRMPLYFSLGFEQRDRHFSRVANEYYSKLYVFQETRGDKAVSGPFQWGNNFSLFGALNRLHGFAAEQLPRLDEAMDFPVYPFEAGRGTAGAGSSPGGQAVWWIRPALDGSGSFLFVVNFHPRPISEVLEDGLAEFTSAELLYDADEEHPTTTNSLEGGISIEGLREARCYWLK
ncbi:hypothetical protein [Lewinella sp. W8]|uniref:hypothetical protein n=1 Tax=Lewinella sp. W8 TaxID=2528208 RepID=UPI001068656C|nr:hypothetical protein [Lewinella sp. W8]MTB51562.1 hypothetical protein [Lewinella sp. W8]